jgi:hypothetical protein
MDVQVLIRFFSLLLSFLDLPQSINLLHSFFKGSQLIQFKLSCLIL